MALTSGATRVIEHADGARWDGLFFLITRRYPEFQRVETVLTLRSDEVIGAEVHNSAGGTEYVFGGARKPSGV